MLAKRGIIVLLALVAIVALPFILRPRQESAEQADDTLVLISPHNEAIRDAFNAGFQGLVPGRGPDAPSSSTGATSAAQAISPAISRANTSRPFATSGRRSRATPGAPRSSRDSKAAGWPPTPPARPVTGARGLHGLGRGVQHRPFLRGGPSDLRGHRPRPARLVDSGIVGLHPDWFTDEAFPLTFGGENNRDKGGLWFGAVLSSYGILFNRDSLRRLGLDREPEQWSDLCDPRFVGEVGLCDPTKSGSIAQCFQNVIQQQIHRQGWTLGDGLQAPWRRGDHCQGHPRGLDRRDAAPAACRGQRPVFHGHLAEAADRRGERRLRRRHVHRLLRPRAAGGRAAAQRRRRPRRVRVAGGRLRVLGRPDRAPARRAAPRGRGRLHRVRPLPRRPEALELPDGDPRGAEAARAAAPAGAPRLPTRCADWPRVHERPGGSNPSLQGKGHLVVRTRPGRGTSGIPCASSSGS